MDLISNSKSKVTALSRKPLDCPLHIENESLLQVKEFKYLGVSFTSEGTMGWEIGPRISTAGAVSRSLYHIDLKKRELSRKAKLLIYQSIFVPSLTPGHEERVMTKRTKLQIQATEKGFLRGMAGISFRDKVKTHQ